MTIQPSGSTRLPGYDVSLPTEADALAALHRVWGAERGSQAWLQACRGAGLQPGRVNTLARLESVNAALASRGGANATVARSIEIRIRTYTRLATRAAATGAAT